MLTLGIDTSNYATSLAVFNCGTGEVVCDSKQFLPVKAGQLGLRQSDALFYHTEALPELLRRLAVQTDFSRIAGVGVSERPRPVDGSYMPCFLAGVNAAAAFSLAKGVPLCRTTHQQGHAAAALYAAGKQTGRGAAYFETPVYLFHVSGGTTDLLRCSENLQRIECLGSSTDLYAGQAVDRLGVRLGYAFPAGTEVSKTASCCAESVRPKVSVRGMECSLSGLQNQCEKLLQNGKSAEYVCKYCLLCIAETILRMAKAALEKEPLPIVFAGGVMSSGMIRDYVTQRFPEALFVPGKYASDNAIGVSILAARRMNLWPNISV
jgi:N6-L-threonylcarbamoyladenine synthase